MSDNNINDASDTGNDSGQKEEYDGSKAPMVIVENLKASKAIKKALKRVTKRMEWLGERVEQIRSKWNDPTVSPGDKKEMLVEYERYKVEVPKLKVKQAVLEEKLPQVEAEEIAELNKIQLDLIQF